MSYYDYDDSDYDRYDAAADAAHDAWMELVQPRLAELVDPIMAAVECMDEDGDYPHPWTWERYLLSIWLDEEGGEDALREELEEHFREEAEELANEDARESGPCCNDFACPCGNTNNYRG